MTTNETPPAAAQDYLNDAVGVVDRLTRDLRSAAAYQGEPDLHGNKPNPQVVADHRAELADAARARARAAVHELSAAGHEALARARATHQAATTGELVDTAMLAVVWPGIERRIARPGTDWIRTATWAEIQAAKEFGPSAIRREQGVGVAARHDTEQRVADLLAAIDQRAVVLTGGEDGAATVSALGQVAQTIDGLAAFLAGGGAATPERVASVGLQLRTVQTSLIPRTERTQ